jgi:hypothetical protein
LLIASTALRKAGAASSGTENVIVTTRVSMSSA